VSNEALVVVDTMVVSALVNERRDPVTAAEHRELIDGRSVVISFVTVTEMRYGALKANWGELRRRELERTLSRLVAVQPDDALMTRCAELRYRCERDGVALGQKVHEADRWIAATALHLDVDLVSDDSAFENIDGLTVLSRSTNSGSDRGS
jgi:predicted nucleic acid-binding protein